MDDSQTLPKPSIKSEVCSTTINTLLNNAPQEGLSDKNQKLFQILLKEKICREAVFQFCQKPHSLLLMSNIFDNMYNFFIDQNIEIHDFEEDEKNSIFQILYNCVNKQLPSSSSKLDNNTLRFIDSISQLAFIFQNNFSNYMENLPTNHNQVAFLISVLSYFDDISPFIQQIQSLILTKMSLTTTTFAFLKLISKHGEIENTPPVKSLISFYKSLPENEIASYAIPTILCLICQKIQVPALKEVVPFISYMIKKVKKNVDYIPNFCTLIDKVLEFSDSLPLIRAIHEDLNGFFIANTQATNIEIDDETKDPLEFGNIYIIQSFLNFVSKLNMSPFEILSQSRDTSIATLILAYAAANSIELPIKKSTKRAENEIVNQPNNSEDHQDSPSQETIQQITNSSNHLIYNAQEVESYITFLISQIKYSPSSSAQFLTRLCGICANKFLSKASLKYLISALSSGSKIAYAYLINDTIPLEFVFPEIVNGFKPGRIDQLYIQAIHSILQINPPTLPDQPPVLDTDSTLSDSNFESILDFAHLKSIESEEIQIPGSPTTTTILFCNLISSLNEFPELLQLLGPSAASISDQFSNDLISNLQRSKHKGTKLEYLSAYSNSIESLDIEMIHSLALTFLMNIPSGQSMLFLAISLQRLPPSIILSALQKVVPYAHTYPDLFGKMIALVAHSHPDIALSYIDAFISNSITKKRVFFIFKTTEVSDETLIVLFKTIGYCSSFIDFSFFISDFIPYATSFMNKHLTMISKNLDVAKASIVAIKKMCASILKYQEETPDHVFPFKDFLVTYVSNFLSDQVEKAKHIKTTNQSPSAPSSPPGSPTQSNNNSSSSKSYDSLHSSILLALASLVPLRPVRPSDRYEVALQNAAILLQNSSGKSFLNTLKAVNHLYSIIMESIPSIFTFINITFPIFPSFLQHSEGNIICEQMEYICEQTINIKITQGNDLPQILSNINGLIVYVLPIILSKESGKNASKIIYYLTSLICNIRNQIESLPKVIIPKKIDFNENITGDQLMKSVCEFLSKHLITSHIFEIITALLELFNDQSILNEHYEGIALAIKYLMSNKGAEEYKYDTKILRSLIKSSENKSNEVISIFMDIIDIISRMRVYSVFSVLVSWQKSEFQNEMYEKIISRIINNTKSTEYLVKYLADNIISDDKVESDDDNFICFAGATIPFLGDAIMNTNDDTWAQLFVGIAKQAQTVDSPLFIPLFNGQKLDGIENYTKKTYEEHPNSLPIILSKFPENQTHFIKELALSFAACSADSCYSFLQYALKESSHFCIDDLNYFIEIFNKIDPNSWLDLSSSIIPIIIQQLNSIEYDDNYSPKSPNKNTSTDSNPIKNIKNNLSILCAKSFLKNSNEDGQLEFWNLLVNDSKSRKDILTFSKIVIEILNEIEVNVVALIPLIPSLIVSSTSDEIIMSLVAKIYSQLESGKNNQSTVNVDFNNVHIQLLKHDIFKPNRDEFIEEFFNMINSGQNISQCITCISSLLNEVNETTAGFIESLILLLPTVDTADQMKISILAQKVLS